MRHITYEQFGVNFVHHAVTAERIAASMNDVAAGTIEMGPMPAGPGGIALVTVTGRIGEIKVIPEDGEPLRFGAVLPIDLNLEVKVGPVPNRYTGSVEVPLALTVRASEPLVLEIEIAPVTAGDVKVELNPENIGGDFLKRVGNMDAEVQQQVARTVNERVNTERALATRTIDIGALVEKAGF
jgi:hypothetical protein